MQGRYAQNQPMQGRMEHVRLMQVRQVLEGYKIALRQHHGELTWNETPQWLRRYFGKIDRNHDGVITVHELRRAERFLHHQMQVLKKRHHQFQRQSFDRGHHGAGPGGFDRLPYGRPGAEMRPPMRQNERMDRPFPGERERPDREFHRHFDD